MNGSCTLLWGGGFQGCSRDKQRYTWRCARAVRKRPLGGDEYQLLINWAWCVQVHNCCQQLFCTVAITFCISLGVALSNGASSVYSIPFVPQPSALSPWLPFAFDVDAPCQNPLHPKATTHWRRRPEICAIVPLVSTTNAIMALRSRRQHPSCRQQPHQARVPTVIWAMLHRRLARKAACMGSRACAFGTRRTWPQEQKEKEKIKAGWPSGSSLGKRQAMPISKGRRSRRASRGTP